MTLNDILTIIGIISPFIISAVWLATLTVKTSNRVLLLEVSVKDNNVEIENLKKATSYTSIEKVVEKVVYSIFNSPQFKQAIKEPIEAAVNKSVRDTMLHINKNDRIAEMSVLTKILERLEKLENHD